MTSLISPVVVKFLRAFVSGATCGTELAAAPVKLSASWPGGLLVSFFCAFFSSFYPQL
jgi:hypothetical protein